ncbi:hypothetical protein ACFTAO_37265 [Paenibacillus rhizoplanae]
MYAQLSWAVWIALNRWFRICWRIWSMPPMLFEVAEGLFQEGLWQAAELLYKNVSASEKYQNSERLALCQYRLFRIAIGDDQARNLQAAHLFEGYLDRLDEADQLDGLNHLGHVYGSMHRWHKVDELAEKMLQLATIRYNLQRQSDRRESDEKNRGTSVLLYFVCSAYPFSSVQGIRRFQFGIRLGVPLYGWELDTGGQ